jgi:hypothetical protein
VSRFYDDLDTFFADRRLDRRVDGDWLEDSFDYGVQWRDRQGRQYRLTWIGPTHRREGDGGELYLVRLTGGYSQLTDGWTFVTGGEDGGLVELLCVIPPAPEISTASCPNGCGTLVWIEAEDLWRCRTCLETWPEQAVAEYPPTGFNSHADRNAEKILDGWADACGPPGSVEWIRERVTEAIARGDAAAP